MAIPTIVYTMLLTVITAQPTEIDIEVKEEIDGEAVGQTSIEFDVGPRKVPLAPERIYEFACLTTGGFGGSPWYLRNNSEQFNPVEIVTDLSSVSVSPLAFAYKDGSSWKLRIQNFTSDLARSYACRTGNLEKEIKITESDPAITMTSLSANYISGQNADPQSQRVFFTGNPPPTEVQWYKDGDVLDQTKRSELTLFLDSNGALIFLGKIKFDHEGVYTAVVSNANGVVNASVTVNVNAIPDVEISLSESATLGNAFSIDCLDSSGDPAPEFSWFFNGQEIVDGTDGYSISLANSRKSVLTVSEAQFSHVGDYKCSATNEAGSDESSTLNVKVLLPPPSLPSLSLSDINYAGSEVTLTCISMLLSNSELLEETLEFIWRRNQIIVDVSADSRLSIQPVVKGSGDQYTSILMLSPASTVADNGNYSCDVRVVSGMNISEYVSSIVKELHITTPEIHLQVTPASVGIRNFAPHNSLDINCTASILEQVTVPFDVKWSENGTELTHGSNGVSIVEKGMSSVLSIAPTNPGTALYTCRFILMLPQLNLTQSIVATINLQGPSSPTNPGDISARVTSYSAAVIKFTVTSIAYSPEEYVVLYGTSSDSLVYKSSVVEGNSNLSSLNEVFQIPLSHLLQNTVYYYAVEARNSHKKVQSSVQSFQTPRIALVQIKAGPFRGCDNGIVLDGPNVQNFFKEKLSERISVRCDCPFPQENLVNGSLFCTSASSNTLIFRVYVIPTDQLSSTEAITHLEEWLRAGPTLVSGVAEIGVYNACNLTISSFTDSLCTEEPTVTISGVSDSTFITDSTLILSGVVVGGLFVLMIVLIIFLFGMICYQHHKLKRIGVKRISNNYSDVNFKRETSFTDQPDRPRQRPSVPVPNVPAQRKWTGDVSVSDCPAYLYSVKPIDDDDIPVIVERQPTPGIYDSIDGLNNNNNGLHTIQVCNPLTRIENGSLKDVEDDFTGTGSDDMS